MAATPEMLAAQAQGGSAGVQAYLAAQQEVAARQQATIASMQADAIKRHSPDVAGVGAQAAIGTDALLNQLAVLQANSGAEDANRQARMGDYARQAAMAGGLIPLQAQADASLIRARGETEIAGLRQQGANRIEEQKLTFAQQQQAREQDRRDQIEYIKWQMRQDTAKSSAEAAAKAAKENTLSATELEAMATLNARDSLGQKVSDAQKRQASIPARPSAPSDNVQYQQYQRLLQAANPMPSEAEKKEYKMVTGKAPTGLTRDQVRRVIGGVDSPTEVAAQKKAKAELAKFTAAAGKGARVMDTLFREPVRMGAALGVAGAEANYDNPTAMRNEVATQAAALRDQGYVVTPEVMSQLLNQSYLSANQYDLKDQGLPFKPDEVAAADKKAYDAEVSDAETQDLNRIATDFAKAFSSDKVPETVRGLNFDVKGLMKAADADYETVATFLDANPDLPAQLDQYIKIVDNPDLKQAEKDAAIRQNFPNPAHRRILSYIVLGK